MPYTIIQAGTALQLMDTNGNLSNLTLPNGASLDPSIPPRWQIFNNYAMLVNTPTFPLTVDGFGTVRPLTPKAPAVAPIIAAGDSGGLTGTYAGVRYTYIIQDAIGNVIAESDFSPPSNSVTIASSMLKATGVTTSGDSGISARRLYRPTSDGSVLFPWIDIPGNTVTTIEDDLSDASLSLVAAPTLGSVPPLTLLKEWRNLLWGVGNTTRDTLNFTEAGFQYSWPVFNTIVIPGTGRDQFGIRSLMPRREALGVGRRDIIWQITGTDPTNFASIKLSENTGVESNETVATYQDTVWWLWKDGVYQWDDTGIANVSDMGGVRSWFTTNSYFNRDLFAQAFAVFDPLRYKYKLYLAGAGSNAIDHWVEYDIQTKTWWGPHLTSAFSPISAFPLVDATDKTQAIAASQDGFVWVEQSLPTDDTNKGIATSLDTKFYSAASADYEKYWGELSMLGKSQPSGILTITPTVGYLDTAPQAPILYDMTQGRDRLPRLGVGKLMQMNWSHTNPGEPVELYGFIVPNFIVGRR